MGLQKNCGQKESYNNISIYLNEAHEKFKFIFDRKTIDKQEL